MLLCGAFADRARGAATATARGATIQIRLALHTHRDHDHKRVALGYLTEAWSEALLGGIDGDCLAQACLFAAFAELVTTYGEEATARFAEGLAARIRAGEFSIDMAKQ
jgi:hypothetical protein